MEILPYIFFIFAAIWLLVSLYLIVIKGADSPELKRRGAMMLIGPMWLVLEKDATRPMTIREILGWILVIGMMIVAIVLVLADVLE